MPKTRPSTTAMPIFRFSSDTGMTLPLISLPYSRSLPLLPAAAGWEK